MEIGFRYLVLLLLLGAGSWHPLGAQPLAEGPAVAGMPSECLAQSPFSHESKGFISPNSKDISHPNPPLNCFRWLDGGYHLRLVRPEPAGVFFQVRDTFSFKNACADSIFLAFQPSPHEKAFRAPARVPGGARAFVSFEAPVFAYDKTLSYQSYTAFLPFRDQGQERVTLELFIAGKDAARYDSISKKLLHYEQAFGDGMLKRVLEVDDMGRPIAFGMALLETGEKAGVWKHWRSSREIPEEVVHSKMIGLQIANYPFGEPSALLEVRVHGQWTKPIYRSQQGSFQVFVREGSDSLRITKGALRVDYAWNYDVLQPELTDVAYFLAPGEDFLRTQHYKYPVKWHDSYSLEWDWQAFKLSGEESDMKGILKRLQTDYPDISFRGDPDAPSVIRVDFGEMEDGKRAVLLQRLAGEPKIAGIAQLFSIPTMDSSSFGKEVYISYEPGADVEALKKKLEQLGFSYSKDLGQGYSSFEYQGVLFGKEMAELINSMYQLKGLRDPNLPMRIPLQAIEDIDLDKSIKYDWP